MPALKLPPKTEFKSFRFEIKSIDEDQGIVTGYLSTFGNVDSQQDRVIKGAFKKTILEAKSRMENGRRYLWPMLFMHDPEKPVGGYIDAEEDNDGLLVSAQLDIATNAQGIPVNPLAVMVFSGYKTGYIDEQSMGYNTIQKDYENGVRNLKECRIVEGSAVVMNFAANDQALVPASGVKAMGIAEIEHKTVCGDTSLPIGPRDEAWDGAAAKKQIFEYASKEDGTIDATKAKKCFLQVDGDTSLKGSYGYPFCVVEDGSPRINVGGVKACAGALAGGRGASTEGEDIAGMRAKVDTMYSRINKKYPNDPELSGTWNEKDKASDTPVNKKTFASHMAEHMCQDLLEDWQDVYICTLTCAVMDALKIGDQPQSDIQDALNAFNEAVMNQFVAQAVQYNMAQYLADNSYTYSPADNMIQNGSDGYGYMSRHAKPDAKAGARFSADSKQTLQDHADALKQMATEHKTLSDQLAAQQKSMSKAMNAHADMLEQKANDLTDLWKNEGQGDAFAEDNTGKDTGKSTTQSDSTKRREPSPQTLTRTPTPQPRTLTEDEELKALEAAFAGWVKK